MGGKHNHSSDTAELPGFPRNVLDSHWPYSLLGILASRPSGSQHHLFAARCLSLLGSSSCCCPVGLQLESSLGKVKTNPFSVAL